MAQGAATQPIVGPFHFPDVTVQVYPLMADRAKLDVFLKRYLNLPLNDPTSKSRLRFETFGSYVYLMVNVYGDQAGTMWSGNNNIGWWAEREVAFCLPVKWYDGDALISAGMIEPFVYANNVRAVITDREVNGRPSVYAKIISPEDVWLSPSGPSEDRQLLHMEIEMFPALGLGQKAELGPLLEIDQRDVLPVSDTKVIAGLMRKIDETWGPELIADLRRKINLSCFQKKEVDVAKALALEILVNGAPINRIALKQYRDADEVNKACYQSLVHTPRSITRVYAIGEILERAHVRLHHVPGCPIAEVLGLKIKNQDSAGGNVVDIIQPVRPFWMHIAIEEQLGRVIGTVKSAKGKVPSTRDPLIYLHDRIENVTGSHRSTPDFNRDWVTAHPWFTAGEEKTLTSSIAGEEKSVILGSKPDRGTQGAADKPYFLAAGDTRVACSVGDSLGVSPGFHHAGSSGVPRLPVRLELKEHANNWLRKSLTYELAFIKSTLGSDESQWEELREELEASDRDRINLERLDLPERFNLLKNSASVSLYCAGSSIESLIALVVAIDINKRSLLLAGMYNEVEDNARDSNAGGSKLVKNLAKLDKWLSQPMTNLPKGWVSQNLKNTIGSIRSNLVKSVNQLRAFPERVRRAAELSMDIGDRLEELLAGTKDKEFREAIEYRVKLGYVGAKEALNDMKDTLFDKTFEYSRMSNPIVDAREIGIEVERVVLDWQNIKMFRRLQRKCAAKAIKSLEELQVVLEFILSDGWANGDEGWNVWERDRQDWQDGDSFIDWSDHRFPVGSITDEWAQSHGLEKVFDHRFGASWIVPKP